MTDRTPIPARDLRVVNNDTAEYMGGHSVELRDGTILAGPYAAKCDAVQAKKDLVAGRYPPAGH